MRTAVAQSDPTGRTSSSPGLGLFPSSLTISTLNARYFASVTIERDFVVSAIIEVGRPRALMPGHFEHMPDEPVILQVGR
jgi:hypothetical protein